MKRLNWCLIFLLLFLFIPSLTMAQIKLIQFPYLFSSSNPSNDNALRSENSYGGFAFYPTDGTLPPWVLTLNASGGKAPSGSGGSSKEPLSPFSTGKSPVVERAGTSNISLASGTAKFSIPLISLKGRNNLDFQVNLTYSSSIKDVVEDDDFPENAKMQVSEIGLGWALDLPRIVVNSSYINAGTDEIIFYPESNYYISSNNVSKLISLGNDEYAMNQYGYQKIEKDEINNKWILYDIEGKKYTFGHLRRIPHWRKWAYCANFETYMHDIIWDLTEIEDIFGNKITFEYLDKWDNIRFEYYCITSGGGGQDEEWVSPNYIRASYVSKITDSAGRVMKFNYAEDRSDVPTIDYEAHPHRYAINYQKSRLDYIEVWDKDPGLSNPNLVQYIKFGHGYSDNVCGTSKKKLLLTSIQYRNPQNPADDVSALPAITFDYTNTANIKGTLEEITSSNGGSITFQYGEKSYGGNVVGFKVTSIIKDDQVNPVSTTTFSYGTLYEITTFNSPSTHYIYDQVTENLPGSNGSIVHYFDVSTTNLKGFETKTDLKNSSTVIKTIEYTWNAYQAIAGEQVYNRRITDKDVTLDNVLTELDYEYNNNNGLVSSTTVENSDDVTIVTEIDYACEKYNDMQTNNILSDVAQTTTWENQVSSGNARSSTVTTYKNWGNGAWAPVSTYQWLDKNDNYTFTQFESTNWTTDSAPTTEWIKQSEILSFDENGNIEESKDSKDIRTCAILSYNKTLPIVTIKNAQLAECTADDFGDNNIDDVSPIEWYKTGAANWAAADQMLSFTSINATAMCMNKNSISGLGNNFIAEYDIKIDDKYSTTDWVALQFRQNDYTHNYTTSGYMVFYRYDGRIHFYKAGTGPLGTKETGKPPTSWRHIKIIAENDDFQIYVDDELQLEVTDNAYSGGYIGFYSFRCKAHFDNLRVYPIDALCASQSYDPSTYRLMSQTDENGNSSYFHYDNFQRSIGISNTDHQLITAKSYYFSRDGNDGDFSDTDPNSIKVMNSPIDGRISNFNNNTLSNWTPYSGTWIIEDGVYKQSNTANSNTNSYYPYNQSGLHYYRWNSHFVSGSKTAGMYFMASSGTDTHRGNSYLIMQEPNYIKLYKSLNNSLSLMNSFATASMVNDQTYTYEVIFDPSSGYFEIYRNGKYFGNWTDGSPITSGSFISLRTNTSEVEFDDIIVMSEPIIATDYFDGFGQTIQTQIRESDNDIIAVTDYDVLDRESKAWKAYVADTDHKFTDKYDDPDGTTGSCREYYDGDTGEGANCSGYPYVEIQYYSDPLSRVHKIGNPGSNYRISSGHEIQYAYSANASDDVGGYDANTLFKTTVTNENGNNTYIFKDKLGNIASDKIYLNQEVVPVDKDCSVEATSTGLEVIDRSQFVSNKNQTAEWWCSYELEPGSILESFVFKIGTTYDGSDIVNTTSSGNGTFSVQADQTYYVYIKIDVRNGDSGLAAGNVSYQDDSVQDLYLDTYYKFDILGNVTQIVPPNAQGSDSSPYCTAMEYNTLGELIKKIEPDKDGDGDGIASEESIDDTIVDYEYIYDSNGNLRFILNPNSRNSATAYFIYNKYDVFNRLIEAGTMTNPGTNFTQSNADNAQYPTSGHTIKIAYCYDNEPAYASAVWSDAVDPGVMNNLKGQLAAQAYKDENTSEWGYTFYSYDQFGNIEWLKQDLPGDDIGIKTIAYGHDLAGNVTKMLYQDGEDDAFYTWYEYDDVGRIKQIYSNVTDNRLTATENADYSYFPFGNTQRLVLGGDAQGVDYLYNTRDWLTDINHQNLNSDPVGVDDRFGLVIGYETQSHIGQPQYQNATPQYNGNISWMIWQTAENTNPYSLVGYTFEYDRANRLTEADFGYYSGGWQTCDNSDLENITYDANGNIQTLTRYHIDGEKMDELTYDYFTNENRLEYINDAVSSVDYEMDVDDQSPDNYSYDQNGNLLEDARREISLQYDYRNLPFSIDFDITNDYINSAYDGAGNRVIKETTFRRSNNETSDTYSYYLLDHLGSTRAIVDEDGDVKVCYDYYPFGLNMRQTIVSGDEAVYKFTGKERDDGSNYDYFGVRYYDSSIGRWMAPDPSNQYHSPFVYCGNNPTNFIDPDGQQAVTFFKWLISQATKHPKTRKWLLKQIANGKIKGKAKKIIEKALGNSHQYPEGTNKNLGGAAIEIYYDKNGNRYEYYTNDANGLPIFKDMYGNDVTAEQMSNIYIQEQLEKDQIISPKKRMIMPDKIKMNNPKNLIFYNNILRTYEPEFFIAPPDNTGGNQNIPRDKGEKVIA